MNLATALELAAHRYPELEAVVAPGIKYNYRQWYNRINLLASGLLQAGIKPGDSVAICAESGEASAALFFALHMLGSVAVFLNARWKWGNISYALAEADVKGIYFDEKTREEVRKALKNADRKIFRFYGGNENIQAGEIALADLLKGPVVFTSSPGIGSQGSTVLYTSGTTGKPKGVCRSSLSDYFSALALILEHRWEKFERMLFVMPLYHTMGLHALISIILLNGTALFLPRADPAEILTLAKSERITALYLVPTIYYDLLKHIKEKAGSNFFVKKLAYAGAPMPVRMIKECQQVFSPEVFVSQYGCTEMLAITINCQLEKKPAAAGRPALQTSIRIVTADNSKEVMPHEILPPGKIGEIIVDASSPQTFLGYLKNPLQTNKVLRRGWYFTGDLGYIDQEGDLHLMGRVDDMIISGGENVYPQEVEQVLLQHPKVKEVAVTGLPHKRFGEIVTAFVVPKEKGLNSRELENFCLEHPELARFKRPRSFVFIEEIPKSAAGKVLRTSLKNGRIITNKEME